MANKLFEVQFPNQDRRRPYLRRVVALSAVLTLVVTICTLRSKDTWKSLEWSFQSSGPAFKWSAPVSSASIPSWGVPPPSPSSYYWSPSSSKTRRTTDWSRYDQCTRGYEQSPINIESSAVVRNSESNAQLLQWSNAPASVDVQALSRRNSNFLEVVSADKPAIFIMGNTYELGTLEIHAPAENAIDGVRYDLEVQLHLERTRDHPWAILEGDTGPAPAGAGASAAGRLLPRRVVVSIMVTRGSQVNPFVERLSRVVEDPADGHAFRLGADLRPQRLFLTGLYQAWRPGARSYYHFMGSVTSPPCTEGVLWFVRRHPLEARPFDVDEIAEDVESANRPPQPLRGRRVFTGGFADCPSGPAPAAPAAGVVPIEPPAQSAPLWAGEAGGDWTCAPPPPSSSSPPPPAPLEEESSGEAPPEVRATPPPLLQADTSTAAAALPDTTPPPPPPAARASPLAQQCVGCCVMAFRGVGCQACICG